MISRSQKMGLLTKEQMDKGLDFTLSKHDFPDAKQHPEPLIEAFKTFPWFFIEHTQEVEDIDGRIIPFRLTKPQRYIERECVEQQKYHNYVDIIILKGRQARISTYIARRGLHYALWHSHRYTIFANVLDDIAKEGIFSYVMGGYNSLKRSMGDHPIIADLLKGARVAEKAGVLEFRGTSHGRIFCQAATTNAVGKNYQFSHLSEVSRMTQILDLWESFYQGIHKSVFHHLILESTARHTGPRFMEIFKRQVETEKIKGKPPSFKAIFIPAYMVDEYYNYPLPDDYTWEKFYEEENEDLYGCEREIATQQWWDDYDKKYINISLNFMKFRRDMIEGQWETEGDVSTFSRLDLFKQNFPMTIEEAELVVGDNVFDRKLLERRKYFPYTLKPATGDIHYDGAQQPYFRESPKGSIHIWSFPEKDYWYTIGFDPAGGSSGDNACGIVWSPIKNHIAAKFKSNTWTHHEEVEMCIAMGNLYNKAIIAYESNYYGHHLLQKFLGLDIYNPIGAPYPYLYRRPKLNRKKNVNSQFHNL